MPRLRRQPPRPSVQQVHVPAPLGGVNTMDAASAMPDGDCVYAYNLVAAENGLRARLGYQEWATGLEGNLDNSVPTLLPFAGGRKSGATDKLFACTALGIWDVSASTAAPVRVVDFPSSAGEAGYGSACVLSTPGGRFLLYADEENGLYVYTEATDTWARVSLGTNAPWTRDTAYATGNTVLNLGNAYVCVTPGVSASSGGPSGTGAGETDGTATWDYVGPAQAGTIGPSLADQQRGLVGDPANFAFVTVWKSRVWLVEKDTSRAWYLDANAIYGAATSFDFGSRMRAGGPLVGLYGWSYDAGNGMDTLLVGLSGAGDVVIYQGTDPSSATTFGLKGTWSVAGVPAGRRIATDFGGDLLILSSLGVVPLSKLVVGSSTTDGSIYATAKIANLLSLLVSTRGTLPGWALAVHPTDNALLVTVPTLAGQATAQLVMSFAGRRPWGQYRGLPMLSAASWSRELYFGTTDGRVCVQRGHVDGVQLADASAFEPVEFSLLTAYRGDGRNRQVQMLRPIILSETPSPAVEARARYDFELTEAALPDGAGGGGDGTWDASTWDASVWGGEYTVDSHLVGASGMGRKVAIALRGRALSRTVVVGFDVLFTEGGLL
jgi:hypothetical protein